MAALLSNRTWILPGGGTMGSNTIGAAESRCLTLKPSGINQGFAEVEVLLLNPSASTYQVTHASVGSRSAATLTENPATGFVTLIGSPTVVPAGDGLLESGTDSRVPGVLSLGRQALPMSGGNGFKLAISLSAGAPACVWGGAAIGYEWESNKIPRDLSVTWSLDNAEESFGVHPCIAVIFYGLDEEVITLPFIGDSWVKGYGDNDQPLPGAVGIPYRLEQRWATAGVNISPVNIGRDGATTADTAARAAWVAATFAPRVMVAQYYSINNDGKGVSNNTVETHFQNVINSIYPQPVLPILLAGNDVGSSNWWLPVKDLEDACVALRPETIDLSAPIIDETDGTILPGYDYVSSHPNNDAYNLMEASGYAAIRTWLENWVEPILADTYALKNTTGVTITLSGVEAIASGAYLEFHNANTAVYRGMDAIHESMLSDATGVNYLLATGALTYYRNSVLGTSLDFYAAWPTVYDEWLSQKQSSVYNNIEDVLTAEANGTFGVRRFAIIAGGGTIRKVNGLWVGDIGIYASDIALPATTYIAAGSTATVGSAATGYTKYYVRGAVTRIWVVSTSAPTTSTYTSYFNLIASVPTPNIGDRAFISGGGLVEYTASGWSGDLGIVPDNTDLATIIAASGSRVTKAGASYVFNVGAAPVVVDVMENPMTTAGDMVIGGASGAPTRLPAGATGTVMQGGATPGWTESPAVTGNFSAKNFVSELADVATSAGTTTLTVSSSRTQRATGTLAHTFKVPVVSTLTAGHSFEFRNESTQAITINSSGDNEIVVVQSGESVVVTCVAITGTTAASWSVDVGVVDVWPTYAALIASGTTRIRAAITGGGTLGKSAGLWLGDIGVYASESALPTTTYLAVGSVATVGAAATGYITYNVTGANGTRVWTSDESVYSVKASLQGAGNLFVVAEQVLPDIIENMYISDTGAQVDGAGVFYISKAMQVTPGDLLMLSVTDTELFTIPLPISFWTAGMAWISTPNFVNATRSYGHLVVPANAAYARLNIPNTMQNSCFMSIVKTNSELTKSRPTKLVALGDSISAGIADAHDPSDLWWKLAGRAAGITDFVTLAVEGSRMSSILTNQLPNIPADADIIQIMTGIPDYVYQEWPLGSINDAITAETFYGGLKYIAEYVTNRYPLARLIFCTSIKWRMGLTPNNQGNAQEDYAEAVRLVASRYCIQLVDFYEGTGLDWTTQRNAEMYLDGALLHPNILGNRLMANKYIPVLKDQTGITTRVEAKPVGQRRTVRHALGLRNIFVSEEQVAPNIIENTYIGVSGEQVSSVAYVVSKAYSVTPGQFLVVAAGLDVIDVPVSFWTAGMVWISTPITSVLAGRTYGLIQVPAGAAFVRLNYATGTQKVVQCYVVPRDLDLYNTRNFSRKLTAIGDSITNASVHTDATNIWWKLAAENAGYVGTNEGRDGATFAWVNPSSIAYRAWNREYATDADVMLVLAGVNDWAQNFPIGSPTDDASAFTTSFYGSLKFTANYLKEFYPLSKHIWCSPIKCLAGLTPNSVGATLADYAKAIIYVATEYGFTGIDIYNDFYDFSAYPYVTLGMTYDRIHPNVVGHRLLANHVQPYLEAGGSYGIPYMLAHAPAGGSGGTDSVLTGLSLASSAVITATDTILSGLGKVQAQVTLIDYTKHKATLIAGTTAEASLNIPVYVAAPTTPVSGDMWNQSGVLKFFDGTTIDTVAVLENAQTFTAQQSVTVSANNALLLNVEVNNAFTQALTCTNTILPTGGQFVFEFGTANSNYNRGHFGFLNVGGAGSNTNAITFGLYGANQLLKIDGTGLATFSGAVAPNSVVMSSQTVPATPATTAIRHYVDAMATKPIPAFINGLGQASMIQENFLTRLSGIVLPAGNGTTVTALGTALSGTGTATAANIATTSKHTRMQRVDYLVTVAATTAVAGFRVALAQLYRGANSTQGGFFVQCRWGGATGQSTATSRCFVGMRNSTSAATDVEPSTVLNCIGMGWDAADANIQFMRNDGSGTATKIDLGASFPVPTTDRSQAYEITLYCPPGSADVFYEITNLTSAAVAAGSVNTKLPAATTMLCPVNAQMSVGGTSSVIGITFMGLYFTSETD